MRIHFIYKVALFLAVAAVAVTAALWPRPPVEFLDTETLDYLPEQEAWNPGQTASATLDMPDESHEPAGFQGWPSLFGPENRGISSESDILTAWGDSGPPLLWERAIGTGYSTPIVTDGLLIIHHRLGDEELVECLDPETGTAIWCHRYPTTYECRFEYTSGPYATPVINRDEVVSLGAQGQLFSLRAGDGAVNWHRELLDEFHVNESLFGVGASPLVLDDRIVLNVGDRNGAGIVAFSREDGRTLWTATDHAASYATAQLARVHEQDYVFAFTEAGLVALDPADGRVFWFIEIRSGGDMTINACSPVVWNDLVLVTIGPGPGSLCVRVLPDGQHKVLWQDSRVLDSTWNNRICIDGCVYGFSAMRGGSTFRCVEMETGRLRWRARTPFHRGSFLAVGTHFLVLGEHGHLGTIRIDPDEPSIVCATAEPVFERPCYSAPALHRGRLYARNEKRLLCFDLRTSSTDCGNTD